MHPDTQSIAAAIGTAQVDALFDAFTDLEHRPIAGTDDREFIRTLEIVLDAITRLYPDDALAARLWEHTLRRWDATCQEVDPETDTEDNTRYFLERTIHRAPAKPKGRRRGGASAG